MTQRTLDSWWCKFQILIFTFISAHIKWESHYAVEYTYYQYLLWKLKSETVGWEVEVGRTSRKGRVFKSSTHNLEVEYTGNKSEMIKGIIQS